MRACFSAPAHRESRVAQLLDQFSLTEYRDQLATALPLGIRQRLLAVAIIHEPDILILDEPTSGVDPRARDDFWRELVRLSREQGVTIFISTHFMNEGARCDRISLMYRSGPRLRHTRRTDPTTGSGDAGRSVHRLPSG